MVKVTIGVREPNKNKNGFDDDWGSQFEMQQKGKLLIIGNPDERHAERNKKIKRNTTLLFRTTKK